MQLQGAVVWLTKLALVTAGGRPTASKQQLGLYAEMLVAEIPPGAFCDASLKAMSEGADHFPAYKILREALLTWYGHHGAAGVAARAEPGYGLPDWVRDKIFENVGGQPGPMLRSWLEMRGVQ